MRCGAPPAASSSSRTTAAVEVSGEAGTRGGIVGADS
jgi:hypothetical protein